MLRAASPHDGNEQIGNAGPAHLAKRSQLLPINMIEEHHAATEHWPLVNRLERPCRLDMLRIHHYFEIARIEFFHAAFEHDASAIDEHEIGQHVLDLFHLVCCHHDGAVAIEVVVEQRIVELFSEKDVETKRRLVQHQQFCVNRHNQSEMQLGHHPLR